MEKHQNNKRQFIIHHCADKPPPLWGCKKNGKTILKNKLKQNNNENNLHSKLRKHG